MNSYWRTKFGLRFPSPETSFLIKKHQHKINHSSTKSSCQLPISCLSSKSTLCGLAWDTEAGLCEHVSLASWPKGRICWWRELEAIAEERGFSSWLWSSFLSSRSCALLLTQREGHAVGLNPRRSQQSPMDSFPARSTGSTTRFPANSCEVAPRNLTTPLQGPQKCHQHPEASIMARFISTLADCFLLDSLRVQHLSRLLHHPVSCRDAFAMETNSQQEVRVSPNSFLSWLLCLVPRGSGCSL